MIAVVAIASRSFNLAVIIPSSLFAADPIARGSAAGNITVATSTPMPSTTRSAGTARRNGVDATPIIPAGTGSPIPNPSSGIGRASADETESVTCRIL